MKARVWRLLDVVDWKLQGGLCLHGLLYGGLVLVAVSCGIFAPLLWDLAAVDPDGDFRDQAIVLLYLHERFWSLTLMCVAVVVLGAIRFSHRVAGPMVRYKRNLRLLANGKLAPPLRGRRSDYLKEEIECLNLAVAGVGERVGAIRNAQVEVRRRVTALLDRAADRPDAEASALITACEQLESTVRQFRHVDTGDDRLPATELETSALCVGQPGGA